MVKIPVAFAIATSCSSVKLFKDEETPCAAFSSLQSIVITSSTEFEELESALPSLAKVFTATRTFEASTPTCAAISLLTVARRSAVKSATFAVAYTRSKLTSTAVSSDDAGDAQLSASLRPHAFEQEPHTYSVVRPSYTRL